METVAFTKPSNVKANVPLGQQNVQINVCLQTVGILSSTENVETNVSTNTTNAMEDVMKAIHPVEIIAV